MELTPLMKTQEDGWVVHLDSSFASRQYSWGRCEEGERQKLRKQHLERKEAQG